MSLPAIRVQDLSKRYQLGQRETVNGSFRELIRESGEGADAATPHLSGSADDGWFWRCAMCRSRWPPAR